MCSPRNNMKRPLEYVGFLQAAKHFLNSKGEHKVRPSIELRSNEGLLTSGLL